ncbi:hypothetical protein F5050DRAFT_1812571 [Lentinula boryana]|uniref:Uncharacterized protein n=1 Tax=Lentinula boryana TaxID=40481 RepID=A0ABQ8PYR4_9AGAR|nr:hypothetical protein F5050DRAFT_1812571 [Lentinula boryana]
MTGSSDAPLSPAQTRRLQTLVQVQSQTERLLHSQNNLLRDELDRQEAEDHLALLTQKVNDGVEDVTQQFIKMGVGFDNVAGVFSTPSTPSTPTRSRSAKSAASLASPPSTPTRVLATSVNQTPSAPGVQHNLDASTPTRPARGTVLTPSADVEPVYTGSRNPAYVVYQGLGGFHGVFLAWKTVKGVPGASDYYNHENHNHVIRSFSSRELAEQFAQEFVAAGIPDLLAAAPPSPDEHFIVVEGIKPMACKTRKNLIMDALQFRGGVAYRFMGDMNAAWGLFHRYKSQGLVKTIHPSRDKF